ncbi:MAG: NAD(P)/FAD-dependent oxidoreductase [Chloroflexi bacterium]|nr:NAD(P)/FAD-dependent oxidoreductase [Chloroflexota bacterium]
MHQQAELVVVGGGPGGLEAALSAASLGVQVSLLDAGRRPGGQYFYQPPSCIAPYATRRQRKGAKLWDQVRQAGVRIQSETLVWDLVTSGSEKKLYCYDPQGSFVLKARAVILATGAYERPAAFPGWTLPGVLLTGGAQTLLYQGVLPGKKVLLVGTGPLQLVVAKKLLDAGAQVVAVLEGCSTSKLVSKGLSQIGALWGQWERLAEGAGSLATLVRRGVPYRAGWGILAAHGTREVEGATIAKLDSDWRLIPGSEQEVACDTVCIGYGLIPFNTLSKLAGAEQAWRQELGGEVPVRSETLETSVASVYAVGDGAEIGGAHLSRLEGRMAGLVVAARLEHGKDVVQETMAKLIPALRHERRFQRLYEELFTPGPGIYTLAQEDTLICRCEGVTKEKLSRAVENGVGTFVEAKDATRCGMGECQGRMCGHQVAQFIARSTGKTVDEVGLFHARPPVFPLPIGTLAQVEEE